MNPEIIESEKNSAVGQLANELNLLDFADPMPTKTGTRAKDTDATERQEAAPEKPAAPAPTVTKEAKNDRGEELKQLRAKLDDSETSEGGLDPIIKKKESLIVDLDKAIKRERDNRTDDLIVRTRHTEQLIEMRTEVGLRLASAYVYSGNQNRTGAVNQLKDLMQINPSVVRQQDFIEMATLKGLHKDESFQKRFASAGGEKDALTHQYAKRFLRSFRDNTNELEVRVPFVKTPQLKELANEIDAVLRKENSPYKQDLTDIRSYLALETAFSSIAEANPKSFPKTTDAQRAALRTDAIDELCKYVLLTADKQDLSKNKYLQVLVKDSGADKDPFFKKIYKQAMEK